MKKKVYYCLPTYKSFDLAYDSVLAAFRGSVAPDMVAIIDNSGDGSGTRYLHPLTQKFANVYIWPQTHNIGVAKAWNTFHRTINDDHIIIANDDIEVGPYTIEGLVSAAESDPANILFVGDGYSGNAFSLFLLTNRGFNTIGAFDEVFTPAYYEDNDYVRRMMLKGYGIRFIQGATYKHDGSSTMKRYTPAEMELHHNNFRRNTAKYIEKWGGLPHQEVYETEYNR